MSYLELIKQKEACDDAIVFCEGKTLQEAWDSCTRSDWMLWLCANIKTSATDKQLRLIAVDCARTVQHLMKDKRSIYAINVAENYANGLATDEELAAAWDAARAAGAAALDAARDAARAARAARAAAWDAQSKLIRKRIPAIEIIEP